MSGLLLIDLFGTLRFFFRITTGDFFAASRFNILNNLFFLINSLFSSTRCKGRLIEGTAFFCKYLFVVATSITFIENIAMKIINISHLYYH